MVFFVLESDRILQHHLQRHGAQVVVYRNAYPYFVNKLYQDSLVITNDGRNWHPATLRFFLYEAWLIAHDGQYRRILHSDVRDVVFQRDPFSEPWSAGIHAFLENPRLTIGNEPYNAAWIEACFGRSVLEKCADKPIACCGVILAEREDWRAFSRVYNDMRAPRKIRKGLD